MIRDMLEIHGNILLDVTKQLKLKFNPLFEKPRRRNLHRFDLWRLVLLRTVSELKNNFPFLEAFSTGTCTILQKTDVIGGTI